MLSFLSDTNVYYGKILGLELWLHSVEQLLRRQDQADAVREIFAASSWEVRQTLRLDHVGALVFENLPQTIEALKRLSDDVEVKSSVAMAALFGSPLHLVRARMPCPVCSTCEDQYIELFVLDQSQLDWKVQLQRVALWGKRGIAMHLGFSTPDADALVSTVALTECLVPRQRFELKDRVIHYLDGVRKSEPMRIEMFSCL